MGILTKTTTIRPEEDPVDTSTSSLGNLISVSDLYKSALQKNNQNVDGMNLSTGGANINLDVAQNMNSQLENVKRAVEKNPELGDIYSQFFGGSYQPDILGDTGTAQYYDFSGSLDPYWAQRASVVQEPTAGDAQVAEQIATQDRDAGITGASVVQPTVTSDPFLAPMDQAAAIEAMTQPEAYNIPGTMPQTPVSGAWGPQEYFQPEDTTPNALEQDIAQVAKDTTQAEFDALAPEIGYGVGEVDPKLAEAAGLVDYSAPDIDAMYTDDRIVSEEKGLSGNPNFWENVRDKFAAGVDIAQEFGTSVADALSSLKDRGIDIAQMTGSAIMNMIAPGLGFAARALPEYEPTFTERTLEEELGVTEDGKFAGDTTTSAFANLNAVSAFGNPVETAKSRIDTRLENIANKGYKPGDEFYDDTMKQIEEYDRVTNKLGDIDPTATTGDAKLAEEIAAENRREEGLKDLGDRYSEIMETRDPGVDAVDPSVDIITPLEKPQQDLDLYQEWEDIINAPEIEVGKAEDEQKAIEKTIVEREMQEAIAQAEAEQRAIEEMERAAKAREEAAQKDREDAANRAAAQAAAAQAAAAKAAADRMAQERGGGGGGFGKGRDPGGGAAGSPFARGGRVRYSKGGIVDLL